MGKWHLFKIVSIPCIKKKLYYFLCQSKHCYKNKQYKDFQYIMCSCKTIKLECALLYHTLHLETICRHLTHFSLSEKTWKHEIKTNHTNILDNGPIMQTLFGRFFSVYKFSAITLYWPINC